MIHINSDKIEKFEQQYGIKLSFTHYPYAWIFNRNFKFKDYPFTFKINDEYYTWCPNNPEPFKKSGGGEWIKDYPPLIEYMIKKMKITFM